LPDAKIGLGRLALDVSEGLYAVVSSAKARREEANIHMADRWPGRWLWYLMVFTLSATARHLGKDIAPLFI